MTPQEAIRLLKHITSMCDFKDEYGEFIDSDPYYEAIEMAISALEIQTNAEEVTSPLLTEKWKSKHRRTES